MVDQDSTQAWKTKPTDRFVLRWIKLYLSSFVTRALVHQSWLRPSLVTGVGCLIAVNAGIAFGMGYGILAGFLSLASQVLDGVDGQLARLTRNCTDGGAFFDSVLDRYSEGVQVVGLVVYLIRWSDFPQLLIITGGTLALISSQAISYTSARAETLNVDLGKPTLASKGTRSLTFLWSGFGSAVGPIFPLVGLTYLAIHPSVVVVSRLFKVLNR